MSEGAATMLSVTDLVAFLGPVLAVAVSVLALAKGLDELTGGARLRNLEGVLREVQKPPAAGADPVLCSLHRATVGQLVAREAVPTIQFVFPAVLTALQVVMAAREAHNLKPEVFAEIWWVTLFVFAMFSLAAELGIRAIGRLIRERARVARGIVRGASSVEAHASVANVWNPNWTRQEWTFSARPALGLVSFAAGVGLISREAATPEFLAVGLGVLGVGMLLLMPGFTHFGAYVVDDSVPTVGPVTWQYPPASAAATLSNDVAPTASHAPRRLATEPGEGDAKP